MKSPISTGADLKLLIDTIAEINKEFSDHWLNPSDHTKQTGYKPSRPPELTIEDDGDGDEYLAYAFEGCGYGFCRIDGSDELVRFWIGG